MSLISNFDADNVFWEVHPQFKFKEPFKSIYSTDKSKNKKDSSQTMWFISYCYDLSENNIFHNLPNDEKHSVVGKDLISNEKYYSENKKYLDPLISEYCKMQDTPAERQYREWMEVIEKRRAFIKTQDYNLETFEALDKMAVGTEKINNIFDKIKESLSKEKDQGAAKGDKELSLSDRGQI